MHQGMSMFQTQAAPFAAAFYGLAGGSSSSSSSSSQSKVPYDGALGLAGDLSVYGLAPSPIGLLRAGDGGADSGWAGDWEGSCTGSGPGSGSNGAAPSSGPLCEPFDNCDPSATGSMFEDIGGGDDAYSSGRGLKREWTEGGERPEERTAIPRTRASGDVAVVVAAAAAAAGPTHRTGTKTGTRSGTTSPSTKPGTRPRTLSTRSTKEGTAHDPNVLTPAPASRRGTGHIKRKGQHRQPSRQPYHQHHQPSPSSQSPLLHWSPTQVPSSGTLSQKDSPLPLPIASATDTSKGDATSTNFSGNSRQPQVLPGPNVQQQQHQNQNRNNQQQHLRRNQHQRQQAAVTVAAHNYPYPHTNSHTHSHFHNPCHLLLHRSFTHPPTPSSSFEVPQQHPQQFQLEFQLQLQQQQQQQRNLQDQSQNLEPHPQYHHYSWQSPTSNDNGQQFQQLQQPQRLSNNQSQTQNLAFAHDFHTPSPAASAASSCCTANTTITIDTTTTSSTRSTSTTTTTSPPSVNSNTPAPNPQIAPTSVVSCTTAYNNCCGSTDMTGDPSSEPAVQDEVAAQHCAAERYEPVLEGPLVGHKLSSDVITAEYAKADPVYVEKTVNLPQTYSHFRPIQGDGNCGWRAIAFSYFEHLVLASDPDKLLQEIARLTSLNNYISNVGGYDFTLFEDMVQETVTLLKEVAQLSGEPLAAMDHLLKRFNDPECANGIIYHMRLLAGSWLKGNVAEYEPFFVGDGGLHHWCHVNIESPNREIDHVGITLLTAILLKPAGFVLEIAYLDRTPGTQANVYRFPEEATGQDADNLGPIIYLLFRPDHYDILYKALPEEVPLSRTAGAVPVSDPSPPPGAGNLQVNLVTFAHQHHQIISAPPSLRDFSIVDYTELARLPGSGGPPSVISSSVAAPAAPSPMHNAFSVSPQSPWLMDPFPESGIPQAIASQPQPLPPAVSTQALPHPPPQPLAPAAQANPTKTGQTVDYQLRFSSQCFHLKNSPVERSLLSQNSFPEPGFTTTMFKNSHFNKAHYNNPQFHPEQWTPDD